MEPVDFLTASNVKTPAGQGEIEGLLDSAYNETELLNNDIDLLEKKLSPILAEGVPAICEPENNVKSQLGKRVWTLGLRVYNMRQRIRAIIEKQQL